eukprot:1802070-Pyramimonas_sp.AAC.1
MHAGAGATPAAPFLFPARPGSPTLRLRNRFERNARRGRWSRGRVPCRRPRVFQMRASCHISVCRRCRLSVGVAAAFSA